MLGETCGLVQPYGEVPVSGWYENKRSRTTALMAGKEYDVLVVPFQIHRNGIDAAGRSLMSRQLVLHLRNVSGLRIPDLEIVTQVLGERRRTFDQTRILELAKHMKVRTIIQPFVGYEQPNKLVLTLRVVDGEAGQLSKHTPIKEKTWDELQFTDEHLPYEHIKMLHTELANWLPVETTFKANAPVKTERIVLESPKTLEGLFATDNIDTGTAAYRLQLIGMLYPDLLSREKERLFERSLIALEQISPDSADYRQLKARALFYLHRRPAAMVALGQPSNHSEQALQAFLNGNIAELKTLTAKIERPFNKLMSRLELVSLYHGNRDAAGEELGQLLIDQHPGLGTLLAYKTGEKNIWTLPPGMSLKAALDEAFPMPGYSVKDLSMEQVTSGSMENSETLFITRTTAHVVAVLENEGGTLCCNLSSVRPHRLDLLELLAAWSEASLLKRIDYLTHVQGLPERALELIATIESDFSGHPGVSVLKAEALSLRKNKTIHQTQRAEIVGAANKALEAAVWLGGQDLLSDRAIDILSEAYDSTFNHKLTEEMPNLVINRGWLKLYSSDFPQRPGWADSHSAFNSNYRPSVPWLYEHRDSSYLYQEAIKLAKSKGRAAADAFLTPHLHRYQGDNQLLDLKAKYLELTGGTDEEILALYRDAIDKGSRNWKHYAAVGDALVNQGQYQQALDAYIKYPRFAEFKHVDGGRVELANNAYIAGSDLFWRGAAEEAKPLYQISSDLNTGSESSLSSRSRLAMIEKNWAVAISSSMRRARRYNSSYAYRDYMAMVHMLGGGEIAWPLLDVLLTRMNKPHIWVSAFIGHRKDSVNIESLNEWLAAKKKTLHARQHQHLVTYAVMTTVTDRTVDSAQIDFISESLADSAKLEATRKAQLKRLTNTQLTPEELLHMKKRIENINMAEHPLVFFARAYGAIQKGQYDGAFNTLKVVMENRRTPTSITYWEGLPYMIWAGMKSDKQDQIQALFKELERDSYSKETFDYLLARAMYSAGASQHDEALHWLKQAFLHRPHTESRVMFSWYQLLELAEWLYEASGDERYRLLALKWARDFQVIQPMYSWAYTIEAKHAKDTQRKRRALGIALYLDAQSERLKAVSESEKAEAREWFEKNNPFSLNESMASKESI